MTDEQRQDGVEIAYVRTTIPDQCRQNAHKISDERGLTIEEVYRYLLTYCLWGEPDQALTFWDGMFISQEGDDGTDD
jgi:hypothetical protein